MSGRSGRMTGHTGSWEEIVEQLLYRILSVLSEIQDQRYQLDTLITPNAQSVRGSLKADLDGVAHDLLNQHGHVAKAVTKLSLMTRTAICILTFLDC